jgi:hypothetical protein
VARRYFVRWKAIFFLLYIDDAIFAPSELRFRRSTSTFRGMSLRREVGGMRRRERERGVVGKAIYKIPQK